MKKLNRMFAIRADLLLDHQWHEIVLHFPIPSCTQRGLHSNERLTCNANTLMLCRRGLHATNHIGSPNMFWHTADIWNAYSLPVSLHACPLFLSTSSVDFSPMCVSVANETAISNKGFGSLLALARSHLHAFECGQSRMNIEWRIWSTTRTCKAFCLWFGCGWSDWIYEHMLGGTACIFKVSDLCTFEWRKLDFYYTIKGFGILLTFVRLFACMHLHVESQVCRLSEGFRASLAPVRFSPVWIRMCSVSCASRMKALGHCLHL